MNCLFPAATILTFIPTLTTGIAAILVFAAVYIWQRKRAGFHSNTVELPAA